MDLIGFGVLAAGVLYQRRKPAVLKREVIAS
jgi:hypothetical protein